MDKRAQVTSIEALDAFRSALIVYLEKAGGAIEDVRDEIRRTRTWLVQDQRAKYEGLLKRQRKQLEQAESELFTSRLSAMTSHSAARQMAVTRLRRLVKETEEKLAHLKKWARNFDSVLDPLAKKLDSMQDLFAGEMPKGVTYLANAGKTLDAYRRIPTEGGGGGLGEAPVETEEAAGDESEPEGEGDS